MEYSVEQEAILAVPGGFCMVCANAGTGKTEVSAELFVRRYLQEEKVFYPQLKEGEHVGDQAQFKVLSQFIVVTFTNRAAKELDIRIKNKFKKLNIPEPKLPNGQPVNICRTLDSLLQRWFFHPLVTKSFITENQNWGDQIEWWRSIVAKKNTSYPEWEQKVKTSRYAQSDPDLELKRNFIQSWGMLITPETSRMLLGLILTNEDIAIPIRDMQNGLATYLAGINLYTHNWLKEYLQTLNVRFSAEKISRLKLQKELENDITDERRQEVLKEINQQLRNEKLREEFEVAFELARSYGYHPVFERRKLGHPMLIENLSGNTELCSIAQFETLAKAYIQIKQAFLLFDFGDFLFSVQSIFKTNTNLLEKDREYPKYGFRGKYCIWDESQDHSGYQYNLLHLLCADKAPFSTIVIGDIKQSIYQWRGAQPQEFMRYLEHLRKNCPGNLFYLTCSYRSAKAVVALGNEIAKTLPSYRKSVYDSSTVFGTEGEIVVLPPCRTARDEANKVDQYINQIRVQYGPSPSILVLWRTNGWKHPFAEKLTGNPDPNLQYLSFHQSKGLEADYVIVLQCNAATCPDIRSEQDQEANLFYVACTRARKALIISIHTINETIQANGSVQEVYVGPSPFIERVATLKQNALAAGWAENELQSGRAYSEMEKKKFEEEVKVKHSQLLQELTTLGLYALPFSPPALMDGSPTTIHNVSSTLELPTKSFPTTVAISNTIALEILWKKCEPARLAGSGLPKLTKEEFKLGLEAGWWRKSGAKWQFI